MMIVGILALVVGLGIGGFAFWQWRKLTMIGGAPLVKTGQLVGNASEKGLISVEGAIQTPEPLIAPCSGRSCLYYEIVVQHEPPPAWWTPQLAQYCARSVTCHQENSHRERNHVERDGSSRRSSRPTWSNSAKRAQRASPRLAAGSILRTRRYERG